MTLNTYLFFDGNCAEAFEFYRSVFGGDFAFRTTFAEAPPDMGVSESDTDKIMHVSLNVGDSMLMGSDTIEGFGGARPAGSNFAISYTTNTKQDADRIFAKLLDGGEVSMPLQDTFWGAYFGQGRDRFGIEWMVNAEGSES